MKPETIFINSVRATTLTLNLRISRRFKLRTHAALGLIRIALWILPINAELKLHGEAEQDGLPGEDEEPKGEDARLHRPVWKRQD